MIKESGYLEWDSNFFDFNVGFIDVGHGNIQQVKNEISKIQSQNCPLIYIFSNKSLDLKGFDSLLVDKKRSYVLSDPIFKETHNHHCQVQNNPEILYDLAFQAGEYSRFKIDPHISEETFQRLYKTWIDNSVNEGFADYVLAAIENDKPVGLITAKKRNDELSIGLFASDRQYRGRGIGSNLIQEIINIAVKEKVKVEVTTQRDNETACRFYESRGFELKSEEYIYHVWYTKHGNH